MRDENWLAEFFHEIWDRKFSDVKKKNNLVIRWKSNWKNKFGHIRRLKNKDTEIGVNSHFKDERIPEYVIELTIAHEIVHYMHGFHSPHPKLFKHPHKGGIVNKELVLRGYSESLKKEKAWFKKDWQQLHKELNRDIQEKNPKIIVKHLRSGFRFF